MTNEKAVELMYDLRNEFYRKRCTTSAKAKMAAKGFAGRKGLKFRAGDPAIIYEPGSERVILISDKPGGRGIHMDVAVSPVYAMLDEFDSVIMV